MNTFLIIAIYLLGAFLSFNLHMSYAKGEWKLTWADENLGKPYFMKHAALFSLSSFIYCAISHPIAARITGVKNPYKHGLWYWLKDES